MSSSSRDGAARSAAGTGFPLLLRLAFRDLRGGRIGLGLVVLCLLVGVAAIAGVGGLRNALRDGIAGQRRAILGGDLSVDSTDPLPPEIGQALRDRGFRTTELVRLRSMLFAPDGGRMLVEVKAVDPAYPLVGALSLLPAMPLSRALEPRSATPGPASLAPQGGSRDPADGLGSSGGRSPSAATPPAGSDATDDARKTVGALGPKVEQGEQLPCLVAEPLILDRLHLRVGDVVRIGEQRFRLSAALAAQPDGVGVAALAPAVVLSRAVLEGTRLLAPGALATFAVRGALPDGAGMDDLRREREARAAAGMLQNRFPGQGLRLRDVRDADPGLERTIDQLGSFMTLIGLSALLLGGVGVGAGVSSWLESRRRTVAVLRCLGAPGRIAVGVPMLQVVGLCGIGICLGGVLGASLPPLLLRWFGSLLPLPPAAPAGWVLVRPVLLAMLFGALAAACFILPPLMRASRRSPLLLFRDQPATRTRGEALADGLAGLVPASLLVALAVATSPEPRFAAGFCVAVLLVLGTFRAAGGLLSVAAGWVSPRAGPVWLRLGLAALHRPGSVSGRLLLSFGAGLTVLATLALVERSIRAELLDQLPRGAPSFYFIDLQPDELDRFDAIVRATPGTGELRQMPSLRARVVSVDGVPAASVKATPDTAWALRGDRGLTIAPEAPAGTHLVAGGWWPRGYDGPPLLSVDAHIAAGWGVHVGSHIALSVLGREIGFRVESLRDVQWRSLQMNFAFVASPGLLSAAPHGMIATVATSKAPQTDAALLQAVTDALPNVTGIRVADVLDELSRLVHRMALALSVMGGVALLSGALVLATVLAADQRRRVREAAILRCLGATGPQLRRVWLAEFALLGCCCGLIAAAAGAALCFVVMRVALQTPWRLEGVALAATICGAVAIMLLSGLLALRPALRARPASLLRRA
ncbi:ABC transporter permease [Rhizosaccharibacter radicis]|uniref:ABC transporter permease n=1 Tax=Rhizosaccharibacter radicis TaxID=2782605 RepID=A0ABT1VXP8_9PROT|nr:ABC transporter permease [Acetobacteraceae bacterium KSS12]